jgi:uroporphyrinogen decarboxylase
MYGGKPERVPCVPLIDNSYAAARIGVPVSQCFMDPVLHAEALVACLEHHPAIDGLSINLCLAAQIMLDCQQAADGYLVKTSGGLTWQVPTDDVGTVKSCDITSFDDPRMETDDPFKPGILETLRAIPADIRRRYLINVGVTGPFCQVEFLMGLNRVLLATLEDPDGLHAAIEKRLPLALRWIDELAELDPAAIWIGEGVASSSVIGPHTYREFVLPYEQALAERIRQLKVPSVLHICGKVDPILEDIPQTGVDCFEADWPVNMVAARARLGKRVSLKGNLNTTTLVKATPQAIYQLSRRLIQDMADGSFILSSGCALGRDTPPENVDAMAQAALESYGVSSHDA